MKRNQKIGLVTFQNAYNYGAILQMYSLYSLLRELGYSTTVINYKNEYFIEYYINKYSIVRSVGLKEKIRKVIQFVLKPWFYRGPNARRKKMDKFIKQNIEMTTWITRDKLRYTNKEYDTFIVGSDQVWNMGLSNYDKTYFLDFAEEQKKIIAYAASIGKEYITGFEFDGLNENLGKYDAISVREKKAKEILENFLNISSDVVLDPTLLHDRLFWDKLAEQSDRIPKKKYILLYIIQESSDLISYAERIAEEEDLEIVTIFGAKIKSKHTTMRDASIEDFLGLIKNATYTFVTSFHGLVFSIIFNTPFYYELAKKIPNNNSRLIDLCSTLHVEGREIRDGKLNFDPIDWEQVNSLLTYERRKSISWLEKALED